jgi:repressor LexA
MDPGTFKRIRQEELGLTQQEVAEKLHTTRMTITRYENGVRKIPGVVEVAIRQIAALPRVPMLGIVAAGAPIEPVPQTEFVDVPPGMGHPGKDFALRVTGESMRDDGILPGDLVIVRRQSTARSGDTIVALVNGQATIKKYYPKKTGVELRPANPDMQPIVLRPGDDFQIQGVLLGLIRYCR